jgi:hypothetical protein
MKWTEKQLSLPLLLSPGGGKSGGSGKTSFFLRVSLQTFASPCACVAQAQNSQKQKLGCESQWSPCFCGVALGCAVRATGKTSLVFILTFAFGLNFFS